MSLILIVDDEPAIREALGRLLSEEGYDLAFASSGPEALDKAVKLTPDLILLDVMLPGMDGFEICRRLRDDPLLAQVPVVMLTALADDDSRLRGLEAGADDFVSKPFDDIELLVRIRTITRLDRYRQLLQARLKHDQAQEALRRRKEQLENLREIGLELSAELDLDTLLHSIVSRAIELLGGTAGGLFLHRPDQEVLEWAVSTEPDSPLLGTRLQRGKGLAGKVWQTGRPLIVDDYQHWPGRAAAFEDHSFAAMVAVPIHWGERFLGVLNVRADLPRVFLAADAELLSLFANQAAVAIENARLFEVEQKRLHLAQTLQKVGAILTARMSLQKVFERLFDLLAQVVDYDSVSVHLPDREGKMYIAAGRGFPDPEAARRLVRQFGPTKQENWNKKRVRIVPDTHAEEGWVTMPGVAYIRSHIGARLIVQGQPIGTLAVDSATPHAYNAETGRTVTAFANQAAVAIENARLHEQVERGRQRLQRLARRVVNAQEEERQRLSRELHDEAGQALTALKISLELIRTDLPAEAEALSGRMGQAVDLTDNTMEQIRMLSQDLRPAALDAVGLNPTLESFCRDFSRRTRLTVSYDGIELPGLPEEIGITFYRFLQEALTNVAKHAAANTIAVTLRNTGETLCLSVVDDGRGFDVSTELARGEGIGLVGMQERFELLNGGLEIASQSGAGARLTACVPWEEDR